MARKKGAFNRFVKKEKRKKKPISTVDRTQCSHCLYRPIKGFESHIFGCAYICFTGKRRPSEPSPNCTVFEKYNKEKRKELEAKAKADYWKGFF